MSDDKSEADIEWLKAQFHRFCSTQSNEGGRLSLAKSKWSEVEHFLRVNAQLQRERMMSDQVQTAGERGA